MDSCRTFTAVLLNLVLLSTVAYAGDDAWVDSSPHTILHVTVQVGVDVEVLDWGGEGRSVVLLAGLGDTAHVFDEFAAALANGYHVYGITRRGFGASSAPPSGYTVERLSEDVVQVLDALDIESPVIAGHSVAGEELNVLGAQYADRIAGLIYLDAAIDRSRQPPADYVAASKALPPPHASTSRLGSGVVRGHSGVSDPYGFGRSARS
jgi:pimeloyl-ACP methyl ester carboxylesterase